MTRASTATEDKQFKAQTAVGPARGHFVVKPFVQTPDAEIKLDRDEPHARGWADRWARRCGNGAVSIIVNR